MLETSDQQILEFLQKPEVQSILLCLPEHPSVDALCAGLALRACVEKMGKRATLVSENFTIPSRLKFLPIADRVSGTAPAINTMTIAVDVSKTKADNISYETLGDKLLIYLTPHNGTFIAQDVVTKAGFAFDMIITLGSPDLETLGSLFLDRADFFHHTPVINIDHTASNEQYGQVNHVDVTATSTSEVVARFMFNTLPQEKQLRDEGMTTLLLCGMIAATRSFQVGAVTPNTLTLAAQLVEMGAERENIIRNLYQSHALSTMRLWGRVCARLQEDRDGKILWSKIAHQDVVAAESSLDVLPDIIDTLLQNATHAEYIVILATTQDDTVEGWIHASLLQHIKELFADFLPDTREQVIHFTQTQSLEAVEQIVLERLRKQSAPALS